MGVSRRVQTHGQQWDRASQFTPQQYSAAHLARLTSQTPFQKQAQRGYVFRWEAEIWQRLHTHTRCHRALPELIVYQQHSFCVRTSICRCQRGFPSARVAQSKTERGKARALTEHKRWRRNSLGTHKTAASLNFTEGSTAM